jgi:integrase
LIEEAEDEIDSHVRARKQKMYEYISNFRLWLESKHLAPMTIETRIRSVKSFYRYNGIIFISMERSNSKPIPPESNYGIPTKDEIRIILKKCDPLEKAIVLVGASSGLASNEICNLKIKAFENEECEDGITTLKLVRAKTNYKFVTFLSREATEAVRDYLKYRGQSVKSKDQKRRNEQLYKQKLFDDEGYLVVSVSY